MEFQHFIGKIAQKAIIEKDGKVLLMHDPRDEDQLLWEIPGGRLHVGEDLKTGLAREIKEELGIDIEVGELIYTNQFEHMNNEPHIITVFVATMKGGQEFVLDPKEVEAVRWVSKDELDSLHFFPHHRKALDLFFAGH